MQGVRGSAPIVDAHSEGNPAEESADPRSPGGRAFAPEIAPGGPQGPVAVDLGFDFDPNDNKLITCVGALAAKIEAPPQSGSCRAAFITAGHCAVQGQRQFVTMTVGMQASGLGQDFVVKNAPGYLAFRNHGLPIKTNNGGAVVQRIEPAFDSALIKVELPCHVIEKLPVTPIALGEKPKVGDKLTVLRRHKPVVDPKEGVVNPGGGNAVTGAIEQSEGDYLWKIGGLKNVSPQPGKDGIYGGDSGGPVVDAHGHLFSVLSRGLPGSAVGSDAWVDSQVPEWADQVLRGWGFPGGTPVDSSHSPGALASNQIPPRINPNRTAAVPPSESVVATPSEPVTFTPNNGAAAPLSDSQRRAIHQYENDLKYASGKPRYRFPENMFTDVPNGGTGKIIIAYFGKNPRPELEALEPQNPMVDFRFYHDGSPEHGEAAFWNEDGHNIHALAVDGLGRKIGRFNSPEQALRDVNQTGEPALLQNYLAAKRAQQAPTHASPAQIAQVPVQVPPNREPSVVALPGKTNRVPSSSFLTSASTGVQGVRSSPETLDLPAVHNREPLSTAFAPHELGGFIQNNCAKCHGGGTAPPFPQFVSDWEQWKNLLDQGNPSARVWLAQFNSKVVHGEMLAQARLSKTAGPGKDFHDFIAAAAERYPGRRPSRLLAASFGGAEKLGSADAEFMIDPAKKNEYLAVLRGAKIADPEIARQLKEFDAIWDTTGNPAWSWAPHGGDGGKKGARPVATSEPAPSLKGVLFDFVNGLYKWKEPFADGFAIDSNTKGLKRFSIIRFPRDASGNLVRGVAGFEKVDKYISRHGPNLQTEGTFEKGDLLTPWASFPPGTRVYEVLYTNVNGKPMAVDILSREKRISPDGKIAEWIPDALRADSSPEKIRNWVAAQTDTSNPDYAKILTALNNPVRDAIRSNLGSGNGGAPFVVNGRRTNEIVGSKSVVRDVSQATIERLFRDLAMESASGKSSAGLEFSNVYSGAHRNIDVSKQNCRNCHSSAGQSFRTVFGEAGLADGPVFSYGNVGGYDSVLGAPWFSPQDLRAYQTSHQTGKVNYKMRPEWAKFFQTYDKTKHDRTQYRRSDPYQVSDNPLLN